MSAITSDLGLWIFHHEMLIGRANFDPQKNEFSFEYDSEWVQKKGFILSPHLRPGYPSVAGAMTRFLENLLPEGEGLVYLAQMLKVNKSNLYALISAIGKETTGALTLTTIMEAKPNCVFRIIERPELESRIKQRHQRPIMMWDGKPRLSLAGVQEKLPIVLRNGQFGLGEGEIASTHILKFGSEKSQGLVINEYFCMKLAHDIGLDVAECSLLDFGERVLMVKRFDRHWQEPNRVQRIHVIDGCQALDLRPNDKYERFLGDQPHVKDIVGPATLKNIFEFCFQTQVPARDQLKILQWVFFNLLIGNSDHHVKNLSFFVDSAGIRLAPFYDLVSVSLYPQFEQALAFHIGDTFQMEEVNGYHLAEMSSELGLKKKFIATQLKKICEATLKQLEKIEITVGSGTVSVEEADFVDELKNQVKARSKKFLKEVPEIVKFKSI